MRTDAVKNIICRDRGGDAYEIYSAYDNPSPIDLGEAARRMLNTVPPSFGACVMISAGLVAALNVHYSIPAVAILGDLKIDGVDVFKCKGNIPVPSYDGEIVTGQWDGHCWVEVGGVICDLSIFRSAYATTKPSLLKQFVLNNFGEGKGALLSRYEDLPSGIDFIPRYALVDSQLRAILEGLSHQAEVTGK